MNPFTCFAAAAVFVCGAYPEAIGAPPAGAGAFATGRYSNLFLEAGYPQKEISAKIQAAFEQLFHGDKDTQ